MFGINLISFFITLQPICECFNKSETLQEFALNVFFKVLEQPSARLQRMSVWKSSVEFVNFEMSLRLTVDKAILFFFFYFFFFFFLLHFRRIFPFPVFLKSSVILQVSLFVCICNFIFSKSSQPFINFTEY